MANWAEIDENNLVTRVTMGNNDYPNEGYDWLVEHLGGNWIQTSYNTHAGVHYNPETGEPSEDQTKALRGNYAGIGYTYDETLDAFIPPTPYESWVLDEATYSWVAPIPYPEDGKDYTWDEDTTSWIEVTETS